MKKHSIRLALSKARQAGFTLIELMAVLIIVGGIYGGVMYYKRMANNSNKGNDTVAALSNMASKISGYYSSEGYVNVTPAAVNGAQMIAPPLTWDGSNIHDAWGNVVSVAGGTTSFAISLGGTTSPLDRDTCVSIANQLANGADAVNAGAAVTVTGGTVGGGSVYKSVSTGTTSMATLTSTSGCATTPSGGVMVGAQYH